ncbi:tail protein X [Novosphingobium sp. KACC 22771]|uniref:tail protein X n=1 Tax=Novosphingobium sp. KACC 22771 TaxID=3025670 RepID=UPI002365E1E6|nr:tail protein X [Novosphingobium sp. KACC 22771]WDF71468.1 tail protein X [Novosphingobium sp. KACC 22771]
MTTTATARANERLDTLCYRILGTTTGGVVEAALALNPGLAGGGSWIAEGTQVTLPDVPTATPSTIEIVKLWD